MAEPFRTSITVAAEPHQVFPFFTDPTQIVRWIGDFAVLDPTPGGEFTLDIGGVPVRGRYVEVDPPHRVVVTWGNAGSERFPPGSSTVEVTLTRVVGGTQVDLEHRALPGVERDRHASGWPAFLARLKTIAALQ